MRIHLANKYYTQLIISLSKQKTSALIFYTVCTDVIITLIFSHILFPNHTEGPKISSRIEAFFIMVLIGPFIETLLFQHLIIKEILKKRETALLLSCLISATLFSISHHYSWAYVYKTFLSGLLFASLFLATKQKNQNPIFIVFLAHAIYNGIGLVINILTDLI